MLARRSPLALALASLLLAPPADAAADAAMAAAAEDRVQLPAVQVRESQRPLTDQQAPPEIEDGKLTVGKKATRIELDAQPAIVDNNWRQLLARAPGLLLSEQPIPSHYNVNYRGLGDPHESEFVLFAVDGIPVLADWFGYPTLYFSPPAQQIESLDFIRGGSGLLYGPQPGPVVNLLRRAPDAGAGMRGRVDLAAGSEGLRTGYAELAGGSGRGGWLLDAYASDRDGERPNSGSSVRSLRAAGLWEPDSSQSWELDVSAYDSMSEEPGRLSLQQFQDDPMQGTTPTNRIWIERADLQLRHQRLLGESSQLTAKLWSAYLDRLSRRAAKSVPGGPLPSSTTFDRQRFRLSGFDARVLTEWGDAHSLTWGTTLYTSDSPRTQKTSSNVLGEVGDVQRFAQERRNDYAAVFAENAFRFGDWSLVPAIRIDRLEMAIEETQRQSSLRRDAIDRSFSRTETLLGLGASRSLGDSWLAYGNFSQGYRPMRYDDIANPTAELAGSNDPDPARADNFELGVRGAPASGWFIDISLFRIDLEDKIEQRLVGITDIERINSGDARHQGLEFSADWNLLHGRSEQALSVFINGSLLDAEIVRSASASLLGRTPAYAPERILRTGLLWQGSAGERFSLTGTYVSDHFWQDSNLGSGSGANALPAVIESYAVWDAAIEWPVSPSLTAFAGMQNITDRIYSSRFRSDGIEVAPRRNTHLGVRWTF
ncbi:MAG: TonB-dependent receptor [Aquimonas sp.]|nr:TonB-dependent receptor [Aquimonas sp.]